MPFGKYRDYELDEIPEDYLEWLLENADLRPRLLYAIEGSLRLRARRRDWARSATAAHSPSSWDQLRAALAALARERAFREQLQEVLKTTYRELALRHHPDRGGSHEAMIAVNEMYERLNGLLQLRAVSST
jgi:hypothetical protein